MSITPDKPDQSTDDINDPNPSVPVPDPKNPLASAFAEATQQSPQSEPTDTTRRRGSLGDLAREVSGTRSRVSEEGEPDQQED